MENFDDLYKIIVNRIKTLPKDSYVASLVREGKAKIAQKFGEESTEFIIEAVKGKPDRRAVISEASDILFHYWVLLAFFKISPKDILIELQKRHKLKSNRS